MSINRVFLVGNLGQDPEIRTLEGGQKVAQFSVATTDKGYTNREGKEIPDRTEWHSCVAWGHNASFSEYAKKGDKVTIEGHLSTKKWEDKNGANHYTTSIVVDKLELPAGNKDGNTPPPPSVEDAPPAEDTGLPF